jgi:hypothetical protein
MVGWTKFVKINMTTPKPQRKRSEQFYPKKKKKKQQLKENGKGWLRA